MLDLALYQDLIHLNTPFSCSTPRLSSDEYDPLIDTLLQQTTHLDVYGYVGSAHLSPRNLLYARLIARAPFSLSEDVLERTDRLLAYELNKKPITNLADFIDGGNLFGFDPSFR